MSESFLCKWEGCENNTFTDIDIMYSHLTNDHVGRKTKGNLCLTCKWENCGHSFTKRDHITSHVKIHIPYKPFPCQLCNRPFKRAQDLKKHLKTHSEDSYTYQKSLKKISNSSESTPCDPMLFKISPDQPSTFPNSQNSIDASSNKGLAEISPQKPSPYSVGPLTPSDFHNFDFNLISDTRSPKKSTKRGLEEISESIKKIKSSKNQPKDVNDAIAGTITNLLMLNPSDINELPQSMLDTENICNLNQGILSLFPEINDLNLLANQNTTTSPNNNLFHPEDERNNTYNDFNIFNSLLEQIEENPLGSNLNTIALQASLKTPQNNNALPENSFSDLFNTSSPIFDANSDSLYSSNATPKADPNFNTIDYLFSDSTTYSSPTVNQTSSSVNYPELDLNSSNTLNSQNLFSSVSGSYLNSNIPYQQNDSTYIPPLNPSLFKPPESNQFTLEQTNMNTPNDASLLNSFSAQSVLEAALSNCIYTKLLDYSTKIGINFTPSQKIRLKELQIKFIKLFIINNPALNVDAQNSHFIEYLSSKYELGNIFQNPEDNTKPIQQKTDNTYSDIYRSMDSEFDIMTKNFLDSNKIIELSNITSELNKKPSLSEQINLSNSIIIGYNDILANAPSTNELTLQNTFSDIGLKKDTDFDQSLSDLQLKPNQSGFDTYDPYNFESSLINGTYSGRTPNEIANSMLEEIIELGSGYDPTKVSPQLTLDYNISSTNSEDPQLLSFNDQNNIDYFQNTNLYNFKELESSNNMVPSVFNAGIVGSSTNSRSSYTLKHIKKIPVHNNVYGDDTDSGDDRSDKLSGYSSDELLDTTDTISSKIDIDRLNNRFDVTNSDTQTNSNNVTNVIKSGVLGFIANYKSTKDRDISNPQTTSTLVGPESTLDNNMNTQIIKSDTNSNIIGPYNADDVTLKYHTPIHQSENEEPKSSISAKAAKNDSNVARAHAVKLISQILAKINLVYLASYTSQPHQGLVKSADNSPSLPKIDSHVPLENQASSQNRDTKNDYNSVQSMLLERLGKLGL
ncbi:pH-response transcription factor [Smittium culicis]|uniref:pH-response transcription factor n=2 Tax=Smittium culicis TaxID=133412 RepID=A0A1R1X472_9FUNG|nr:pH-response transcription factor [Smittium culicis]